ncbi:uncharacterized protein LOC110115145 [Dendrobium catenatum]|uniref:Protein SENSITIVE TO UV 2 n=1 Tax=Dendrobium catenatum TaxID=906689 RepID=A0A2I0W0T5_9ASPA|nr:uncharacterized protein LOC110115145 [Dendrobium catenatum]PKU69275.1 hypothetical protein MA16_Dca002545 [Dendrobium catenatum]
MDSTTESTDPMSFDVDEWDENFINEVFQVELGLCSKNAVVNPIAPPPPPNPSSSYLLEQEAFDHWELPPPFRSERAGLSSSGVHAGGSDICFSPPRELSQRFKEVSEDAPVGDGCVMVESRISRNGGFSRAGGGRRNKELERLKKELEHLSKKFTHMEQDCITLKKDRDQKNEQLKCVISQLEAKDAEICTLKRENLGACEQNQPHASISFENKIVPIKSGTYNSKLKVHQANGSAVSELKRRIMIDDQATTSCEAQECSFMEKSTKTKHSKSTGIQTDVGQDAIDIVQQKRTLNDQGIVSNLHAIWGLYDKRSGSNLVLKLLRSCSAEFFTLFRCIKLSSKCNLDGLANESFSEIPLHDSIHSIHSSDSAKASRFYQLLMKMRHEIVPLQDFIDALLELCNLDNAVAHVSMRILHATLQHLVFDSGFQCTLRRSNVFVGKSNDESFTGEGAIAQENQVMKFHDLQMTDNASEASPVSSMGNLCMGDDQASNTAMFLSFGSLLKIFEMMEKIVVRNVDEYIRLEGLLIMSLIMMECKPNIDREKFGSVHLLQTLSTLMSTEAGVHVRKQAVRLMFLLLNSPKMLVMLCSGQADCADHAKADDTHKSTTTWKGAIKSMLENIAECLNFNKSCAEELKFRRRVIILLAFIASSGKPGFEVLLRSVTPQQINFLELIIQLLAYEMDAEIPNNCATQDLCKERISLIREALILLNRLASHPSYAESTLRVLTGNKATASLTIEVANRLSRRIQAYLKHYGAKKTQVLVEINDLARLFRVRVFTFLGVPIS